MRVADFERLPRREHVSIDRQTSRHQRASKEARDQSEGLGAASYHDKR